MILSFLSKYSAPFMWSAVMLSTLMLLSIYDAESFLVSFVLLMLGTLGAVLALPNMSALQMTKSPVVLLMLAFWAVALFSVLCSEMVFTSFTFFCFLGVLPLGFIFVTLVPDKEQFFPVIFMVGVVVLAVLSALCLVQYFLVPELLPNGLTQYPFGNPNSLAGYLSLGFFCSYGGLINSKTRGRQVCFFLLALLIITAMFTTGSRGAFVALLVGCAYLVVLLRTSFRQNLKLHGGFVVLAMLSFIALTVLAPDVNHQTPGMVFQKSLDGSMPLLWDRPHIWASTWEIIKDNFWTGTGAGTFSQVYPSYRGGDFSTAGHMAHNDVLQFWAEMGVFSPLIFCGLLGFAIFKTVRVLKILPLDDARRTLISAPFCALGALVLHTQISFHFYALPTLFIIGTLLAFWFYQTEQIQPSGRWTVTAGTVAENIIVKLCLSALILSCTFMLTRFQFSEIVVDSAREKAYAGDMAGFAKGVNFAGRLSFGRNPRALALASTVPSRIVEANGAHMSEEQILKTLLQAEGLLDRALRSNPYMGSIYHEQAIVAQLAMKYVPQQYRAHYKGQPPEVRSLMEQSLHYDPLHANTRVKLADMMIAQGEREEAYALLKDGLKWKYLGTKGMGLYQKTASMALEFEDMQTRNEALEHVSAVYQQFKVVEEHDAALKKKLGPIYSWIH